jgi:hypothetical protein
VENMTEEQLEFNEIRVTILALGESLREERFKLAEHYLDQLIFISRQSEILTEKQLNLLKNKIIKEASVQLQNYQNTIDTIKTFQSEIYDLLVDF